MPHMIPQIAATAANFGATIYSTVSQQQEAKKTRKIMEGMKGPEMPDAPDPKVAEENARKEMMRRRALLTKTNISGPGGDTGTTDVGKKVLLGA